MRSRQDKRLEPPPIAAPPDFRFPEFVTDSLSNGLRLFISPFDRGPLVQISMVMNGGAERDPTDRAGRTTLSAALLDEGTSEHNSMQLAERVENLGGYLATQADWDSMSASVGVLAQNLEEGFALLADVVTGAVMPEHEVERLRAQRLAEIQRRRAQPGVRASEVLAREIYADTPYSMPLLGTAETIRVLSRGELVECAQQHTTPSEISIVATGDLNPDTILSLAESRLGQWNPTTRTESTAFETPRIHGLRIHVVDRPDSPQTELRMGHIGPKRTDPDYVPLQVMNSLLGGKFTSRINLNLREDLGITYGASSGFGHRRGHGPFVVSTSVSTDSCGVGVEEILKELRRLQDEPVDQQELDETKSYLLGVFPYTLQRIEGLANRLAEIAIYDLPLDYYDRSLQQIRAVDVDRVQSLAVKHLHPDRMAVVAVGPADELVGQLEPFGPVEITPEEGP